MEPFQACNLFQVYNRLLKNSNEAYVQTAQGQYFALDVYAKEYGLTLPAGNESNVSIYPGSFNPLHRGHKDIYDIMQKQNYVECLFETSITCRGESELSLEDLRNRVRQFINYAPIVITNLARFVDKTDLFLQYFDNVQFHIGMDAFKRMVEHDYGASGVQEFPAEFIVHERIVDGKLETLENDV